MAQIWRNSGGTIKSSMSATGVMMAVKFVGAGSLPAGAIIAFAAASCPSGWTEYTAARGRFLRGIDNGAGLDPDGTRSPGASQGDAFQGHKHVLGNTPTISFYAGTGGIGFQSGTGYIGPNAVPYVGAPSNDGTNGAPRTSNETRPENVAVTFCVSP